MTRVAAYDLGSNSFHLLVADVGADGAITRVLRRKLMLGLGTTVATTGAIGSRLDEVIETLCELRALATDAGATRHVACATAAFRDAADRQEVLTAVAAATALDVSVISGEVEAELVFHAVRASMALQPAPALCLDLGGGSLELMVGDDCGLDWAASVPLGVARLTADNVRKDPVSKKDMTRLRDAISRELDPLVPHISRRQPKMLIGSSGTLKNLAAAALRRRPDPPPEVLHEAIVSAAELHDLHETLVAMTCDERANVAGLEPRRAPWVVAGSALLTMVMSALCFDELTISEWALREGMLLVGAGLQPVEA